MIYQFLALLTVHWLADFCMQTHWQASNKSKSNYALAVHASIYTVCLLSMTMLLFVAHPMLGLGFVAVNGVLHFATDWCTSRVTSRLFIAQFDYIKSAFNNEPRMAMKRNFNPHNFFVMIGFDQLIHQVTLALTMIYFFGGT